jgi:hypothetical protein
MQSCHVCHQQIACNEEESIYSYTQLIGVKGRSYLQSSYINDTKFNTANSSSRHKADCAKWLV